MRTITLPPDPPDDDPPGNDEAKPPRPTFYDLCDDCQQSLISDAWDWTIGNRLGKGRRLARVAPTQLMAEYRKLRASGLGKLATRRLLASKFDVSYSTIRRHLRRHRGLSR